jgi:uncharacterized protein YjbI with pentapeptide repeats
MGRLGSWRRSRRAVDTMRRWHTIKRRTWRGALLASAGLSLGAVGVAAWYGFVQPEWQAEGITTQEARIAAINDGRRTNAQMLAAVFLAIGAWLTWQNVRIARTGKTTDRLTNALDSLNSPKRAIRVGSLLALDRVARDAPDEHQAILEAVTAFIREETRFIIPLVGSYHSLPGMMNSKWGKWDPYAPGALDAFPGIQEDVQAALDFLRRRHHERDERPINLSGVCLRNAVLDGIHLEGANLSSSTFECSSIHEAHFQGATANGSYFESCSGTADFTEASLHGAHFMDAEISGSRFDNAVLIGCDFSGAELLNCRFREARMDGVQMQWARLDEADLTGADLDHAHLLYAKQLTIEQLNRAKVNESTELPIALTPKP